MKGLSLSSYDPITFVLADAAICIELYQIAGCSIGTGKLAAVLNGS